MSKNKNTDFRLHRSHYRTEALYRRARNARERAYRKYVKQIKTGQERLAKKGLVAYDEQILTRTEFVAAKRALRDSGITNPTKTIVQQQLYKYSYKTATKLRQAGREYGEDWSDLSIQEIRSGGDFSLDFLSNINDQLKSEHPEWNSYQRRDFIEKEWFGYAS